VDDAEEANNEPAGHWEGLPEAHEPEHLVVSHRIRAVRGQYAEEGPVEAASLEDHEEADVPEDTLNGSPRRKNTCHLAQSPTVLSAAVVANDCCYCFPHFPRWRNPFLVT